MPVVHFFEDPLLGHFPPILIDSTMECISWESSPYSLETLQQGKYCLTDVFPKHQGVFYYQTSYYDEPSRTFLLLHLHVLNVCLSICRSVLQDPQAYSL